VRNAFALSFSPRASLTADVFLVQGMSVLEMSHRSAAFEKQIMEKCSNDLRKLLYGLHCRVFLPLFPLIVSSLVRRNVPANYKILFLQGGATAQFAAIPLNLLNAGPVLAGADSKSGDGKSQPTPVAEYIVNGAWSEKAAQEVRA
jgi:phosphoserine aminotransferase